MSGRLEGKTALVTAAAQGIGRATALALAREGAAVIATDINLDKLAELESTGGIRVRKLDVTDEAAIAALCAEIPTPNALMNCAGFVHAGTILDCAQRDWDFAFNLNVRSMYLLIKALLPRMLEAGSGSIVNIASVAGLHGGDPDFMNALPYSATKGGVIAFTRDLAWKWGRRGIRVNAIAPGWFPSDMANFVLDQHGDRLARNIPLGRFGGPEDLKGAIGFLASDASAYVTGHTLVVDGGQSA